MQASRGDLEAQTAGGNHPGGPGTLPSGGLVQEFAAIAAEDAASFGAAAGSWCASLGDCIGNGVRDRFCVVAQHPILWLYVVLCCIAAFIGLVEKIFCAPRGANGPTRPLDRPCVQGALWGMLAAAVLLLLVLYVRKRRREYRKRRREYRARLARDMEMQGVQAPDGGKDAA